MIRCESWRTYSLGYQVSILRANRQIHHEASSIFHLENSWTTVRINNAGVGKEMKDRGFPVPIADDLLRYIRYPIMEMRVKFLCLEIKKQSDVLVIAVAYLKQRMRVLWTAEGASEMKVRIDLQPPLMKNSPSRRDLLSNSAASSRSSPWACLCVIEERN